MENNMMELLYESNILNQNINYYILENKYNAEIGIVTEGENFDKFKGLCQKYLSTFRESIKKLGTLISTSFKKN